MTLEEEQKLAEELAAFEERADRLDGPSFLLERVSVFRQVLSKGNN